MYIEFILLLRNLDIRDRRGVTVNFLFSRLNVIFLRFLLRFTSGILFINEISQ